ncbi:MAG TPA: signal peptidase II [Vicinamibacterales bacterium]|nr:signal peptidase II [Vicinamibacterales bacterium]
MTRASTIVLLAFIVVATIGCDRVTKHVAMQTIAGGPERSYWGDTIRVVYVENTGGFLSLGASLPPTVRRALFTVGSGALLLGLVGVAIRQRWHGWALVGVTLFVAGGASNWIDRVARGSVVDFLNVGVGPIRTGIFNVADVAIMAGAVLVIVGASRVTSGQTSEHGRE